MARRAVYKVKVRYTDDRTAIDYVDRLPSELRPELDRIQRAVLDTVRILSQLLRLRNAIVISAYVQLKHLVRELPEGTPAEDLAAEIARLSYVMSTIVASLDTLTHSRIKNLQEARFALTYGQTPKKRDLTHKARQPGQDFEQEPLEDEPPLDPD